MVGASISMLLANTIQLIEVCSMALNKGDMMKLTGNDRGVDSALPHPWLDKMSREMLIDYDSARFWYAYSYKNNSGGKPVHLGEELIHKMGEVIIDIRDRDGNIVSAYTILGIVESLLKHPDKVEIRIH